jgi:Na+-driven multidrug efflux pump
MFRLFRIGLPVSVNTVLFSIVYLFLSREAAAIGTAPLAALGIGNRVESLSFMSAMSLSVAVATMVGQNLGAGQRDRARAAARRACIFSCAVCTALGLIYLVGAESIIRLFSDDASVAASGGSFLRIIAVSQPMMGIEIALYGVFQGSGFTLAPMLFSSGISLLRIPLARAATRSFGFGFIGIPWVITVTALLRGLILLLIYRFSRWTETRVSDETSDEELVENLQAARSPSSDCPSPSGSEDGKDPLIR